MRSLARAIFENPTLTPLPARLEGGALPALISGLPPVCRANLAAGLRLETGRQLCVLCPDESACESMSRDLAAFLEEPVLILLGREYVFLTAEVASRSAEQRRIAALDALRLGAGAVVCTPAALMQYTLPPELLERCAFTLAEGDERPPEDVEDALLRCGYVRTELVEGVGQFSRRGGVLDFFSPAYPEPVRVEFWGDDVDSVSHFDLSSQRRTDRLTRCRVLPVAETIPALTPGGESALAAALDALAGRLSRRADKNDRKKLEENLRADAERLRESRGLASADKYMGMIYSSRATALDYLSPETLLIISEPGRCAERASDWTKQHLEDVRLLLQSGVLTGVSAEFSLDWDGLCARLEDYPVVMADTFTVGRYPLEPKSITTLSCRHLASYGGSTDTAAEDMRRYIQRGFRVVVLAGDSRRAEILRGLLLSRGVTCSAADSDTLPNAGSCVVTAGGLSTGIEYPDAKLAVLTDTQITRAGFKKPKRKKAMSDRQRITACSDLSVGDLVVHEYHGIGRFAGITTMQVDGVEKDYVKICYAGTDSLYLPATNLDLVSKYIGGGGEDKPVRLSKMGGADWNRVKSRAKAAAKELAVELTKLYAERRAAPGHAFPPDSPWQTEFEDAFEYPMTDDQERCIAEIKGDMEASAPMDRLLCGDVGYGKTEVALRAVMKCVLDGWQAAILVPTTVLAQQHFQTAVQRFFGFPVNIQVLSRFRTPAQIKQTLRDIESGACDIVIGTHRLLSKDIKFKKLGLLVVDEEQRFGVGHKEHIKEMSRNVDVLTLSATPIPRTLNMALSGIRDMSTIEEPPADRLPVQTYVMEHDWNTVCEAIRSELRRGGQVYYLHNRVENIERTAVRLAEMLEDVSVSVAHGQMDEEQLSAVMEGMANGDTQVLVCTTIIETGIDIPNVNTLIIEDADRLGLAQLHQIRGRVGRSSRRASAYLTFRRDKVLSEVAEKRLTAIREFAEFNSGFRIAMRDLEMRGAGNLLGAEQSGHLIDVGYDMYIKLLEEAVLEERGEKPQVRAECSADLSVSANIPERYIGSAEQRMDIYRRIALIRTEEEADDMTDELIDRYGDPPPSVNALVQVALLRGEASRAGIGDISQKGGQLLFALADFDMARVSTLYAQADYKGRVRVEAGSKPCLSLKLRSRRDILGEARAFIKAYSGS